MTGDGKLDVYLVRHAFAGHANAGRWPNDAHRPLTAGGVRRFTAVARGLRKLVPDVDVVLASGHTRAWETAALLHQLTGWPEPREERALEAGRPATAALEALAGRTHGSVALVGHEPCLSRLASLLCTGDEETLRLKLKKGAVTLLEIDGEPRPASASLRWAAAPAVLRALDGRWP